MKLSILPASPDLAGAEIELVNEVARETLLKRKLLPLAEEYDYILVDCPPSLGTAHAEWIGSRSEWDPDSCAV